MCRDLCQFRLRLFRRGRRPFHVFFLFLLSVVFHLVGVGVELHSFAGNAHAHMLRMNVTLRGLSVCTGVDVGCVSVKATTTERLGFEGEELGVSATAVVLIYKE